MSKNFRQKDDKSVVYERLDEKAVRFEKLNPAIYQLWDIGNSITGCIPQFEPMEDGDKLVKFKTGIVSDVINEATKFFSEKTKAGYAELKITHKMGMLFYGRPGTGKTSICMLIMKELVEKYNAIALDCTGKSLGFIIYTIERLREIQDNPIVLFVDEFDYSLMREENRYLTFLDGTDSVGNSIFMGCTNYIDKIPDRIKDRKSRFKKRYAINSLPEQVYKEYLTDRVPSMDSKTVSKFAYLAVENELTIDQVKHALIDHRIEGVPIDKAIEDTLSPDKKKKKEEEEEKED